ncbi:MAG: glycosyltransferase family 4 protein [Lentisphaerae bacterium]|jgi:colanic acid/amylovoran biosynthesis glycosyltransferase|nr:glycosyltransferase family 4 protein [Lentisphaerota bacterium]MBT4817292.1 glycosyltransferase family 4 protein [Lentisphaerota bacterium]MBT5607725.1 glycosyltransferase family 4 protein [Lentisphaerota bacterium]MBT7054888.1 glycosyltransferase family 4 protein [Lentisphaerota bacterium]MBT7843342.1 glycosyltransferase family 4 protein [Lentisphaerota bacterium]
MERSILYLLGSYPRWSETFLRQDLTLLQQLGVPLLPVALQEGDAEKQADWPAVQYLDPGQAGSTGISAESAASPGKASRFADRVAGWLPPGLRTQASLWKHGHWLRLLTELVRESACRHLHAEFADIAALMVATVARDLGLTYSLGVHARDIHAPKFRLKELIRGASFVTVCNAAALEQLQAACEISSDRVHLIYHGLILKDWSFAPPGPVLNTPIRLLFVGRLVAKKGLNDLIRAIHRAKETGLACELTIVGSGPEEEGLRTMAKWLCVHELIHWHGVVPRERVRQELLQADCLVVPSVVSADGDRDGIPNVVVEAMAVGRPVIGTRVGGLGEALFDETAWLCEPGKPETIFQRLREVHADPQHAWEKCGEARRLVERSFDALVTARDRAELFRTMVSQS